MVVVLVGSVIVKSWYEGRRCFRCPEAVQKKAILTIYMLILSILAKSFDSKIRR